MITYFRHKKSENYFWQQFKVKLAFLILIYPLILITRNQKHFPCVKAAINNSRQKVNNP